MNKLITFLITASFSVSLVALEEDKTENDAATMVWSQANKHFTTTFYPYARNGNDNLLYSPLSLQLGLAMAAELAYDKTQQEILKVGVLPEDETTRHMGAQQLVESVTHEEQGVTFHLANGAWISSEISAPAECEQVLIPYYRAETHTADFRHDPEGMCAKINSWVQEKTFDKIQNLLPHQAITSQTACVLVNTLYMHAPWAFPFNPEHTYQAPFYAPDKPDCMASYMRKVGSFRIIEEATYHVVELPFEESVDSKQSLSLFVVLPHEGYSLEQLESELSTRRLDHWIHDTQHRSLILSIPKFKLTASLDAKKILQNMGMNRPFSSTGAEFLLADPQGRVAITDIVHKAVLEIDEQGGTGSAATGIGMRATCCWPERKDLVIDRPFLVFVVEKQKGFILFAGRVTDPQGTE